MLNESRVGRWDQSEGRLKRFGLALLLLEVQHFLPIENRGQGSLSLCQRTSP
jgi:hypothetical protein